jgi:hypothetical protein
MRNEMDNGNLKTSILKSFYRMVFCQDNHDETESKSMGKTYNASG